MLNLYDYIDVSKATKNPLILTSFDIKSGLSYSGSLRLKKIIQPINSKYADLVYKTDSSLTYKTSVWEKTLNPISLSESQPFQDFYSALGDSLIANEATILNTRTLTEVQYK